MKNTAKATVSKIVKSVKATKGKGAKASASGKAVDSGKGQATGTVQAVTLSLDVKQNHSMRAAFAAKRVDLFATHSEVDSSKGYQSQVEAADKAALFKATQGGQVRILIVNGIANVVRVDSANEWYGRNGKLAQVASFDESQAIYGNVKSLQALYGKRVELLTEAELLARFNDQKETVTRLVGGKKKERVTGRIIASGSHAGSGMVLDVVANKLDSGKVVCVNCESKNNSHNTAHRFSAIQATASK